MRRCVRQIEPGSYDEFGTREEYEAAHDGSDAMVAEERRLRRISEVEKRVVLSAVFELVEEVLPPAE